jgi:hypothetical protein
MARTQKQGRGRVRGFPAAAGLKRAQAGVSGRAGLHLRRETQRIGGGGGGTEKSRYIIFGASAPGEVLSRVSLFTLNPEP